MVEMLAAPPPLTARPAWQALRAHARHTEGDHLRDLFAADPTRGTRLTAEAAGIYLDYSKQRVSDRTLELLIRLAESSGLPGRVEAMFAGDVVNVTERRAALHVALRAPRSASIHVDGVDVVPEVHDVLERMGRFASDVRDGTWRGFTGRRIRTVVNIGIGGSDLGPRMAAEALRHYSDRSIEVRFVSNVDGTNFVEATRDLDASETLFIVSSKSFTTAETMANAGAARAWVVEALGDASAVGRHFVAVSTNAEAVRAFGIGDEQTFGFWDWVGGRYSLPSAVGLSTMIAIGPEQFRELLAGYHAMDEHFRSAPLAENVPALHGLLTVWNTSFLGMGSMAVVPYDEYLGSFPAYLQQLTMESNGKRVTESGEPVGHATGPVVWGERGTNGQHSFFQQLHQGTATVPCDLIGFLEPLNPVGAQHDLLMAHLFAQSEALAFGKTAAQLQGEGSPEWLVPHRVSPGNRPTSTLLLDRLTPYSLGSLIALYEHSVFTQGVIWGIDSFDQWGVELGKQIAASILEGFDDASAGARDSSTTELMRRYRERRGGSAVPTARR